MPPELDGKGAGAWRASAWDARGKRGEERTLDVQSPALVRLFESDATQARAAGAEARTTLVSARARLEECAGRRDNYRRENGILRDVVADCRALLGKRVVVGLLEAVSSFGASAAYFGLTSLPLALITGGRVVMAAGTGLIVSVIAVWGIPMLVARGLRRVNIGPRIAALGLGVVVLGGILLASAVGLMRGVSSLPMDALTSFAVSAGGLAIIALSVIAVLVLMAYSAFLELDQENLEARRKAMAAREDEFARTLTETQRLIESSERNLREADEVARRLEVIRAAFGQAVTAAEHIEAECAIDIREPLLRALDAFRHLMALSIPDRELVHTRVVALVPGVADA
ncbi:MAG: hypothetical protein Q8P41_18570 [Pseudomonadota bacterium]|nr:hypothetical protein [Pseudomonadota bacterium]